MRNRDYKACLRAFIANVIEFKMIQEIIETVDAEDDIMTDLRKRSDEINENCKCFYYGDKNCDGIEKYYDIPNEYDFIDKIDKLIDAYKKEDNYFKQMVVVFGEYETYNYFFYDIRNYVIENLNLQEKK